MKNILVIILIVSILFYSNQEEIQTKFQQNEYITGTTTSAYGNFFGGLLLNPVFIYLINRVVHLLQ